MIAKRKTVKKKGTVSRMIVLENEWLNSYLCAWIDSHGRANVGVYKESQIEEVIDNFLDPKEFEKLGLLPILVNN